MQCGLQKRNAAERQRILDAAVTQHVVIRTSLAAFADTGRIEHAVGWTGDLEVVQRHHHRHATRPQQPQDRGRDVVIDVMSVADIRGNPLQQPVQLAARLHRVNHLRHSRELLQHRILRFELDLIHEIVRPRRWADFPDAASQKGTTCQPSASNSWLCSKKTVSAPPRR